MLSGETKKNDQVGCIHGIQIEKEQKKAEEDWLRVVIEDVKKMEIRQRIERKGQKLFKMLWSFKDGASRETDRQRERERGRRREREGRGSERERSKTKINNIQLLI